MITDTNPSVIFGLYSKPEKKKELLEELKKLGVGVREISFIDVEIPPERKDEIVNFFKHFVLCDYWAHRNPLNKDLKFFGMDIKEKLFSKIGYKPISFKAGDWQNDHKHPLIWTLAVPLAYQDQEKNATSKEEKKAIQDLKTFSSEGYKPKTLREQGIFKEDEMEILKDEN